MGHDPILGHEIFLISCGTKQQNRVDVAHGIRISLFEIEPQWESTMEQHSKSAITPSLKYYNTILFYFSVRDNIL